MKYHHLSIEERVELYAGLGKGEKLTHIAKRLERNVSTLSRELKRHTKYARKYTPVLANNRAIKWAAKQRCKAPLKNSETFRYVMDKLKLGWSPEIISGRLPIDHPELSICHESIYSWIYSKKWYKHQLWKHLDCGRLKRRQKRGRNVLSYTQVLDSKSIDFRPDSANERLVPGHGESDLVESGRESKAALSVTVDRLTRVKKLAKVRDKTSRQKTLAIFKSSPLLFSWLTMTVDKGSENKDYSKWEKKLNIQVYFCHSYHSWEKGSVERTNKDIRRFIPKGADIADYSWRDIQKIEDWLNNKPMKCLQYLTPYEKMFEVTQSLKSVV